jgi:ATP-dependent DNA helicase RecG
VSFSQEIRRCISKRPEHDPAFPSRDRLTHRLASTTALLFLSRIVENIRAGNSNLRTPTLASFVTKGVLPYRGLGAGVPRALEAWPDIDFRDDREGGLFVATVKRKPLAPGEAVVENAQKATQTTQKLLDLIAQGMNVTRQTLAKALGITPDGVKYHLRKLQEEGLFRRVGPDKGGHGEVTTSKKR